MKHLFDRYKFDIANVLAWAAIVSFVGVVIYVFVVGCYK